MTRIRVRQHVNPLSSKYQNPLTPPHWEEIYHDPRQPLHLDLGSARGTFLLEMAQLYPKINFLGLEIRQSLVEEANLKKAQLGLNNLHYLFSNINIDLGILCQSLPEQVLHYVTIQFPDPWFKKRHQKRRVVQPFIVDLIADYLVNDGTVFLQSDVENIAREMVATFEENPVFRRQHEELWRESSIFPVATEREIATLAKPAPIYRCWLQKKV